MVRGVQHAALEPAGATDSADRSPTPEIALVRQHLATDRLVTITAVGGSGHHAGDADGEEELDHRPGGVWFVDLTSVMGEDDVPAATAARVGMTLASGDIGDQVLQFLADKTALVILDNCEHLVDACADFGGAVPRPQR